ncbi:signal recognition particle-docking protein FtsY [Ensifer sp. ENS10]|uniref:signal recognition particle-docking protein FtsY n=1 Tax=unclassified Ensifer TaxID=2633371 RepID=UPI00070A917F|nr:MULTISPECIES: signal recognition particle-docking protein FtsY [unclassified Ensifer]KRD49979.1 signal recognition particle-docking protein FtsY [Ensifer sp. Root278]MBD9509351.1 signal recognition particle-docking protein FtsY [Ensifer sp. ENS10]
MAMGFIKRIFTFGKGAVEETKPPEGVPEETIVSSPEAEPSAEAVEPSAPVAAAEIAEETPDAAFEPPVDIETLPLSEDDPVLEAEIETAGGPASDDAEELTRDEAGATPFEDSVAIPPSVPSGHLPQKEGDQTETKAAIDDASLTTETAEAVADEKPADSIEIIVTSHVAETIEGTAEALPTADDAEAELRDITTAETPVADAVGEPSAISPPVGEMPGKAERGEAAALPKSFETTESDAAEAVAEVAPTEAGEAEVAAAAPALPKGFATTDNKPKDEPFAAPKEKLTWYQRLRRGLARTSSQLTGQIASLFTKRKLDEATLQDLEDLLIQADLGVETAMRITDTLASERYGKDVSGEDVSRIMAGEITKVLAPVAKPLELDLSHKPHVILVVGVNGTGKTTTIGKLAAKLSGAGLKVMLAAGDTFRAAAIEQLKIWAERTKSDIVSSKLGADAAGLAYEAFQQAREKKSDVLIIDTAGRLQNKAELMAELEKIVRVLGKLDPDAPHTVLQTLDATTGQNALQQVEIFRNIAGVSGLIMTKLDGTARGGILVAISAKHKLPVYFIGVGEGIDDLEPFEAKDFAEAIAGVAA